MDSHPASHTTTGQEPADTLIHARWLVPVLPQGEVLHHHALAIRAGRIVAVLPSAAARQRFAAEDEVELPAHVLIPGLVNAHCHAAMTLLRGVADDLPLERWLQEAIWPLEARLADEDFVHDGTLLACQEMLRGGITCCNDMYFHPQAALTAFRASGMRAVLGAVIIEFPTRFGKGPDDYLAQARALHARLASEPLLHFALAPHAPYTVGDATLARVAALAGELGCPVHIHIHETAREVADGLQQHGCRPLDRLAAAGLLGPQLIGVHGVHLNDADIAQLAAHGAHVVHCPVSNMKLASGIAPLTLLLASGVNVALGTDGAASNNRLDMLAEMRQAALLAKVSSGHAEAADAHTVLRMATLNGAQALGMGDVLGSLTVGKQADLCAIRLDDLLCQPVFDPVSHLLYVAGREQVSDVWISGQARLRDGQLLQNPDTKLPAKVGVWQNRAVISP